MKKWMFWMVLGILGAGWVAAQQPAIFYPKIKKGSSFYYDVPTLAGKDSTETRVRIYSKIAYDDLQFIKKPDCFYAKYELSATLFDKRGNQVEGDIANYDIRVYDYDHTNSRRDFSYAEHDFIVPPGEYELLISVMDHDSKKNTHWKVDAKIPRYFDKPIAMSSIILADSVAVDSTGGTEVIVPNVIGNYENDMKAIQAWFEIYSTEGVDSVQIDWEIKDIEKKTVLQENCWKRLSGQRAQNLIRINRDQLKGGRYILNVLLTAGEYKIRQQKSISIHWMGMPSYASNIDDAIHQIKYIARGKEFDKIEKAEDKQAAFQAFWKSKDPSPNTEENELMEEYYRRVDYANQHFASMTDGWRTDRGMVHIILGGPDDIERHPFEPDSKPYIVWYYYQLNREFVFVDYTGFGDYRLLRPFWDIMGRMP